MGKQMRIFKLRNSRGLSQCNEWAMGQGTGVQILSGTGMFFSAPCPDRFCVPPSLRSNGYRGSFPGDNATGAWNWPLIECVELYLHTPIHLLGVLCGVQL